MLIERITLASARHGKWVISVFLVLAAIAVYYSATVGRINSDLGSLIRPSTALDWYQYNERYKSEFPFFDQTALVVVSGPTPENVDQVATKLVAEFTRDTQHFHSVFAPTVSEFVSLRKHYFLTVEQLEQWLQGIEYNYGPALRLADEASVANFLFLLADHLQANRGLPLPTLLSSGAEKILSAGTTSLSLLPSLDDPDATIHYQLIVLQGIQDVSQQLPNEEIVKHLRKTILSQKLPADVLVRLTGEIPLAHEEIEAALNGVGLAGIISIALLALILGFGIRSTGFVFSIFSMLAVGVALTLGLAVLVVGSFNTLSLIFVVMFFGLGVDFAVHFGLRVRESQQSESKLQSLSLTARDVGPALLMCMLTSSIAFLAFVPTAYVGLAELGLISAMGMAIAFVLSITLLPALLSRVDLRTQGHDRFSLRIFILPPRPVLLGFLTVIIISGWYAKDLKFDYSVLAMRDVETEGMQTLLELQQAKITTDYSISVLANGPEQARQLSQSLEQLDEVASVTSPTDLVPQDQLVKYQLLQPVASRFANIEEVLPGESPDIELLHAAVDYLGQNLQFARNPDQPLLANLVQAALDLKPSAIQKLNKSFEVELNQQQVYLQTVLGVAPFSLSNLPKPYIDRLISAGDKYLLTVQPARTLSNRDATTAFIEAVASVAPNYAGRSVVEWGMGGVVVEAFVQAIVISVMGILFVLVLYFRSIVLPLLVLLPTAASLLMTFAICELTGLSLNMANILIVPLIIGLGVDTGIHVVHRARSRSEELHQSSTARAVVISALTTIGTFFSLSFSPHLGAASIGLLLTVAISLLVVVTFVLLPILVGLIPSRFLQ